MMVVGYIKWPVMPAGDTG